MKRVHAVLPAVVIPAACERRSNHERRRFKVLMKHRSVLITSRTQHSECFPQSIISDETITKDDIFDYIYGILHAPSYRDEFANDLSKMIPRIPFAPDFRAFTEAGQRLADLHLNYETCEQYPDLKVEPITPSLLWEEKPEHFRLGTRAMRLRR